MRKPVDPSPLFSAICERRQFIGFGDETKDCGVVALTVVASISYDDAREILLRHGYRLETGIYKHMMIAALKELHLNPVTISAKQFVQERYPLAKQSKVFVTPRQVERFPEAWKNLPPCLLWTNNHVLAVKDRQVHDWSAGRSYQASQITFVLEEGQKTPT